MDKEIRKAVKSINMGFDSGWEDENFFYLQYSSNGFAEIVEFLGYPIWNSEDDDRGWIEDENKYEPAEPFLRKQMKMVYKQLTKSMGMFNE